MSKAKELLVNEPDSALVYARAAIACMDQLAGKDRQAAALITLGDANLGTGDMPAALDAYQRAQLLVEDALEAEGLQVPLVLARSDIQLKIGALHFYMRNWEKSVACYNEAMRILDATENSIPDAEMAIRKVRLFNNIAGVYIQRGDHATALPYFQQAVELNRPLNDLRNESSLNNNIGICHMEVGRYDLAEQYFLKALAVRKQNGDLRGQAQVLNNLGKNQVNLGNFQAARDRFEQALEIGRRIDSPGSMVISLEALASVYDTLGAYKA
ncbi:MAG: tetratricopeptide repeat protein, partial [Flavobacteriales bacterium]